MTKRGQLSVLLVVLLCMLQYSAVAANRKRILVINSYHNSLSWTDSLNKGFTEGIHSSGIDAEYFTINLDAKRLNINTRDSWLYNFVLAKVQQVKPNLIAVTDDDALLLMEHLVNKDSTLLSIPVVFMGVNTEKALPKNFTGIFEVVDIKANLELIRQFHPGLKNLYCVVDMTTTGRVLREQLNDILIKYSPGFSINVIGNCSYNELIDSLKGISRNDAILFFLFNQDKQGRFFTYEEILDSISHNVGNPIYGPWSFYLTRGIIGGSIISGYHHGIKAGKIGALLLKNVSVTSIPQAVGPQLVMLDYRQLKRFSISSKTLPTGAIIVNKPGNKLSLHPAVAIAGGIAILSLALVVVLLWRLEHLRYKNLQIQKLYIQILEQKNQEVEEGLIRVEQANELKTAFLANMSHEIRTPMNAIVGFSKLVLDSPGLTPEEVKDYLNIITENAQRLMRLINDIIDISKIDSHQMSIYKRPVQLGSLFSGCYRAAEVELNRLGKNSIALEMSFTPQDAALEVMIDPDRVNQVVMNLLNNAIKFTLTGRIVLGYTMVQNLLRVTVEDTGIGIDPQNHGAIFERFRQIDGTPNREYGGSGLGLSICKGVVEAMGGRIGLSSELGKGTTFWFEIPADHTKKGQAVEVPVKPQNQG